VIEVPIGGGVPAALDVDGGADSDPVGESLVDGEQQTAAAG
jgi:hypothetical protein